MCPPPVFAGGDADRSTENVRQVCSVAEYEKCGYFRNGMFRLTLQNRYVPVSCLCIFHRIIFNIPPRNLEGNTQVSLQRWKSRCTGIFRDPSLKQRHAADTRPQIPTLFNVLTYIARCTLSMEVQGHVLSSSEKFVILKFRQQRRSCHEKNRFSQSSCWTFSFPLLRISNG